MRLSETDPILILDTISAWLRQVAHPRNGCRLLHCMLHIGARWEQCHKAILAPRNRAILAWFLEDRTLVNRTRFRVGDIDR